jgi:hypothetical protein
MRHISTLIQFSWEVQNDLSGGALLPTPRAAQSWARVLQLFYCIA